jgi:hypothetical protein
MPNHFHFVISSDIRTIARKKANQNKNVLSEGFRNLLSSYTQAINKQNRRTGSLFQQNTKANCLNDGPINYARTAFHYTHQNAYTAGLVTKMEDWEYSSFRDYVGLRNGTLCNKQLAYELLDLDEENFYKDSYAVINNDLIYRII